MQRLLTALLALAAAVGTAGCGGGRDQGINKDKDRPKAEERKI